MTSTWFTQGDAFAAGTDVVYVSWHVPVLSGAQLQRTLMWVQYSAFTGPQPGPGPRALPGMVGFYQNRIDSSEVGGVNVHDGDLHWAAWGLVDLAWRFADLAGSDYTVWYQGWGAWDVGSQRTALTDDPLAELSIHTIVGSSSDGALVQPTFAGTWNVRQLWTHS